MEFQTDLQTTNQQVVSSKSCQGWSVSATLCVAYRGFPLESNGASWAKDAARRGPRALVTRPYAERIIRPGDQHSELNQVAFLRVLVRNPNYGLIGCVGGSLRTPMPATDVSGLVFVPRVSEYRSVDDHENIDAKLSRRRTDF
jgi:hypothetical protein